MADKVKQTTEKKKLKGNFGIGGSEPTVRCTVSGRVQDNIVS